MYTLIVKKKHYTSVLYLDGYFRVVRGDQRGGSHINWKNTKIRISLTVPSQLF